MKFSNRNLLGIATLTALAACGSEISDENIPSPPVHPQCAELKRQVSQDWLYIPENFQFLVFPGGERHDPAKCLSEYRQIFYPNPAQQTFIIFNVNGDPLAEGYIGFDGNGVGRVALVHQESGFDFDYRSIPLVDPIGDAWEKILLGKDRTTGYDVCPHSISNCLVPEGP